MKKSDLKNGILVELRDGSRWIVTDDGLISLSYDRVMLNSYGEDLKRINREDYLLDVMKAGSFDCYKFIDIFSALSTKKPTPLIRFWDWEREVE